MAKNKNSDAKKKISFAIAVVLLSLALLGSVVLFVISSLMHGKTSGEFTKSLYPVKYEYYVEGYAKQFGVDVCLVYGVIRTESGFDPNAVSQAGAIGLMQLMPDTFTWLQNYRTDFMPEKIIDSKELYEPSVNIEYGTYLLRFLLDHYDGDTSLAIIAYNAGYGNVDDWLANGTIPKGSFTSADVPFSETANYLDRVTEAMEKYRELYYSDWVVLPPESEEFKSSSSSEEETQSSEENEFSEEAEGSEYYTQSEYIPDYIGDGTGEEYFADNTEYYGGYEDDNYNYEQYY